MFIPEGYIEACAACNLFFERIILQKFKKSKIKRVQVWTAADMYAIINNMESIYRTQVFGKATGRANNYRIPSVITTKHGTVVACADERFFSAADFPNRIDKVLRRSEDGGRT